MIVVYTQDYYPTSNINIYIPTGLTCVIETLCMLLLQKMPYHLRDILLVKNITFIAYIDINGHTYNNTILKLF